MRRFVCVSIAMACVACDAGSPSTPTAKAPAAAQARAPRISTGLGAGASLGALANNPPQLSLRTTPPLVGGIVSGLPPLDVTINLCQSSDPDAGDSLRSDVDWGDGTHTGPHDPGAGTDPENGGPPTGCGGSDCCRHRHRFERGDQSYTVTVALTDKHLEDQGRGLSGLARTTSTFRVVTARVFTDCWYNSGFGFALKLVGPSGQLGNAQGFPNDTCEGSPFTDFPSSSIIISGSAEQAQAICNSLGTPNIFAKLSVYGYDAPNDAFGCDVGVI